MENKEAQLQIRTLNGESTSINAPSDTSIRDLKLVLKDSFLPAKHCPNFHLFFKGSKLSLEAQIESIQIGSTEFLVLIPFTKKRHQQTQLSSSCTTDQSATSAIQAELSHSTAATWQDIMTDLSSLSQIPNLNNSNNTINSTSSSNCCLNKKRKVISLENEEIIHEIIGSKMEEFFENKNKVQELVDSMTCLKNDSKRCLLFGENYGISERDEKKCFCPDWLKRLLKLFALINLIYGFFQVQNKCVLTWELLEGFLKKNYMFESGEEIGLKDLEIISLICPKVVVIAEQDEELNKPFGSIVILNCSKDFKSEYKVKRKSSVSYVVNAIAKRWNVFKSELCNSIKHIMEQKRKKNIPLIFSIEDILLTKENRNASNSSNARQAKTFRCNDLEPLEPHEMIEHLKSGLANQGQIVHIEQIEAKDARQAEFPDSISTKLKEALKQNGISKLYIHQADAVKSVLEGKNVAIATSASSGKSLCYNIPVLETLSQNSLACALYIFPTKALSQDQLRNLMKLQEGLNIDLNVRIYDGDTLKQDRLWIRDNSRIIITNPDMLHVSILPYHDQFERLLSNLRYIVIDEAHMYKGAFGCHTSLVLRRLKRICSNVYGSDPIFIFCTATSANPHQHALELANLESIELVQKDGSPHSKKYFLLWNPPMITTNGANKRSSPIMEASYLFADLVQHGLKCIAFCKSRNLCELVLSHTREILQAVSEDLVDSIAVYRAGYISEDRRKIEADLFEGKLRGVAATNALELGIDVGHIDATLHLGFPGSISSLWQQAGRSGRRAKASLAIYIAFDCPLDQYFMKCPNKLFGRPIEHCQVDSNNPKVLEQHVACAANELPVCMKYDEKYFGRGLKNAILVLRNKGYLGNNPSGELSKEMWSYIGLQKSPSHEVSVRAIESEKYRVVDRLSNKILEEIEEGRAFFQVYEGAVYLNQGSTYLIDELNISSKTAFCHKADLKYFTKTRDYTEIRVTGSDLAYLRVSESGSENMKTSAQANYCKVTTNWFGFYKIWKISNRIFDSVELSLPSYSFDSQASWIRIPQKVKEFKAGCHAASHALVNVAPLYLTCNISDFGTECVNPHEKCAGPIARILLCGRKKAPALLEIRKNARAFLQ
ncbi:hypothetical protein LUZ60_006456 [Juncus effusus]|nr:hypothetical protein LUZ60_006456 [Juncus effusus]